MSHDSYSTPPASSAADNGDGVFLYLHNQRTNRIFEIIRSQEFPTVTDTDGLVLLALNARSHGRGVRIRPSITLVARMTGLDRATVKRSLKNIKDHDLLVPVGELASGVMEYRFGDAVLVEPNKRVSEQMWTKPRIRKRRVAGAPRRTEHPGAPTTSATCGTVHPDADCTRAVPSGARVDLRADEVEDRPYPTDAEVAAFFAGESVEKETQPVNGAPRECTEHPDRRSVHPGRCSKHPTGCTVRYRTDQLTDHLNGSKEQIKSKEDSKRTEPLRVPFADTAGEDVSVGELESKTVEAIHDTSPEPTETDDDIRAFFAERLKWKG